MLAVAMDRSASLAKAQGVAVTMVDVNERALDLAKKMPAETVLKLRSFFDVYEAVEGSLTM